MIICDAAMILFTFDLNHSQNFRPHRKKKKIYIPIQLLEVLWHLDHDLLPWLSTKSRDLLSLRSRVLWRGPGALPPCTLTELRVNLHTRNNSKYTGMQKKQRALKPAPPP